MAKQIREFEDKTHDETGAEHLRRVHHQMDEDSWIGRDRLGDDFPRRGIVHEMDKDDPNEPPHLYDWGKGGGIY